MADDRQRTTDYRPRSPIRRPWSLIHRPDQGLIALATLLLLGHSLLHARYTIDDAAISYVYARGLAHGQGWVFQPGSETVEGVTNLLWVVLLAGGARIGLDPHLLSKVLGLLAALATVWLTAGYPWSRMPRPLARVSSPESPAQGPRPGGAGPETHAAGVTQPPRVSTPESALSTYHSGLGTHHSALVQVFPALLIALAAPVAIWSVAGLETALFGFLLLAGCAALVRGATPTCARRATSDEPHAASHEPHAASHEPRAASHVPGAPSELVDRTSSRTASDFSD